ncbi:MAG: nicotinate phosphoribosyltransferase [Betaproteobacteria bacterium]|nr:nicotinate phosphoribosyltransferase [Betaproteobacteria bacterium]
MLLTSPLLTDLYQLTMLQGYLEQRMEEPAVFEFFVRKLPPERNFLVTAGLEQALDFLENLRFGPEELEWIAGSGLFSKDLVDYLETLRFTGDVHAIPEGTVVFPNEPILRVTAPLPQAQLVETRLINLLHFSTLVASKAARSVLAAPAKLLVDFGLRRAHGAEAGLLAARASYLAGFSGTATVLAGARFGIPVYGTMAHSFVQAHDDEPAAFEHFARSFPGNAVLLIDTYDTEAAARKVVALAPKLAAEGIAIKGVRLDSGDLAAHARKVRRILDQGGLSKTVIFASGNLDEYRLKALMDAGAPIDGFGVGTSLVTSGDAPSLDSVYKLMEYAGRPRRKRSEGKATWPGRKQVYRRYGADGRMREDLMTVEDDAPGGEGLVRPQMAGGRRLAPLRSLSEIRVRALQQYALLPADLRRLEAAPAYPVVISDALRQMAAEVDRMSA